MSLRPDPDVQKLMLSTTSNFRGEFDTPDVLIAHSCIRTAALFRSMEGPASRSAFILSFRTKPIEPAPGVIIPDYSFTGDFVASCLSLLFGKRFDNHGMLESTGIFEVPDLTPFSSLCKPTLPHNSYAPRADYPVPLNLSEVARIFPLLSRAGLDLEFATTLQAAAKYYWQALQSYERDPETAFLNLITAGEILSNYKDFDQDFFDESIVNVFNKIREQMNDGERVIKTLKKRMLSIKKRFVTAIVSLVDDAFFERSECTDFARLKKESFEKAIGAAYDLRSLYVHTGVSFGNRVSNTMGGMNNEVRVGLPIDDNKELKKALTHTPTLLGLERVIRYCLLRFAEKHGGYVAPRHLESTH